MDIGVLQQWTSGNLKNYTAHIVEKNK